MTVPEWGTSEPDEVVEPAHAGHVSPAPDLTRPRLSAEAQARPRPSFAAALLVVLPAAPVLASAGTLTIYFGQAAQVERVGINAALAGAVVGLAVTLLLACFVARVWPGTSANRVQPGEYENLQGQVAELEARLAALGSDSHPRSRLAHDWGVRIRQQVVAQLVAPGPQWVLGTGYVTAWRLLHHAEEALLSVAPAEQLLDVAQYDYLRLQRSRFYGADKFLDQLDLAKARVAEAMMGRATQSSEWRDDPRVVVRTTRKTLNEFRDAAREALVRARNHLIMVFASSAWVTYLLLVIAIDAGGSAPGAFEAMLGAVAMFLVGSLVGLFSRLHIEFGRTDPVDDYGLAATRLFLSPLFSGLAAVGGVLLLALLGHGLGDILPLIGPSPALAIPALSPEIPNAFSLQRNPGGVLIAAVFGLAPQVMLRSLDSTGQRYRADLGLTAPYGQWPAPPSTARGLHVAADLLHAAVLFVRSVPQLVETILNARRRPPAFPFSAPEPKAEQPEAGWYTVVDFPTRCTVRQKAQLDVRLALHTPQGAEMPAEPATEPLAVLQAIVSSQAFAISPASQALRIFSGRPTNQVSFEAVPLRAGDQSIDVELFRGPDRLSYTVVTCVVEDYMAEAEASLLPPSGASLLPPSSASSSA